jgi:hypothetical protein
MQGKAGSSFEYNRTGFCVLHPVKECAGKEIVVEGDDGTKTTLRLPVLVSPWQPIKNIRALSQRFGAGISSELRFFGNVFEMEDQRNWTDGSFKTYCPPLKDNIPFRMKAGEEVSQGVVLRVKAPGQIHQKSPASEVVRVDFSHKAYQVPQLGTVLSDQKKILSGKEQQLLRGCNFSHLRLDVSFDDNKFPEIMKTAGKHSKSINIPIELALYFRKERKWFDQDIKRLKNVLESQSSHIKRILIFRKGEKVTLKETLDAVLKMLKKYAPHAEVVTGTDRYFVEINRRHPPIRNCGGICYSANPQVHTFDDASVIDNLEGQPHTVRAAKNLFPGKDVFITPVTLRPRFAPKMPQKDHGPDPRQKTLFGAAWTLGSIIRLAEAGVSGATYFETTGDCGIMEKNGALVFPLYQVFADIGEFSGGSMKIFQSAGRRLVEACVLEIKNSRRYLIANMTHEKRNVFIDDLPDTMSVKVLDERTVFKVGLYFDQRRKNPGNKKKSTHGKLRILLGPYSITRIDSDCNRNAPFPYSQTILFSDDPQIAVKIDKKLQKPYILKLSGLPGA